MKSRCVILLTLCLFVMPMTVNAIVILQTDASWKVTPANPGGTDWYTNVAFDDTAWQSATELYAVGPILGEAYNGTYGIWSSGGQFSTSETQVWIRQVFNLAGPLSLASLIVGCDDDCTVWVNGSQVINDTSGDANNNIVTNLLPFLNVGTNLVAYTATDNWPVWGFNHSTWLQLDGEYRAVGVPEPLTIALLGIGLLGLSFARRKA